MILKSLLFAFQGIPNIASDDDLNDLFSKKCKFDPTVDYDLNDEQAEVVTSKSEDGTIKKIINLKILLIHYLIVQI